MAFEKNGQTFLTLTDELFMLALCVREENLADPAKWCKEKRAHLRAVKAGPQTVAEAEALMETAARLAEEAAGLRKQQVMEDKL